MERAVPHLPADDLRVAKAFYVTKLGFHVSFEASDDGTSGILGLARGTMQIIVDSPMDGHGRNACVSLEVDDADAYFEEWSPRVDLLRPPRNESTGTSGPMTGPSPGPPPPPRQIIPAERKGDQQALRDALEDDCLALLKGDPDERVRYQALLAVGNLARPVQAEGPLAERMIRLLVDLYRHDSSDRIRAEVVKTFRLAPNNTPEMRGVLRDALVDPSEAIRSEGLTGITPQATATPRRLSFDEARETVVAALAHSDSGIRLGAVRALNVFGVPAAPYIQNLERLRDTDPDPHVRASAGLAIESIQRAVGGPGAP